MSVAERLAGVFQKTFGLDPARFSMTVEPEDVANWDSIGHMGLVAGLEDAFEVQFEVDEITEMNSASRIAEILRSKGVHD